MAGVPHSMGKWQMKITLKKEDGCTKTYSVEIPWVEIAPKVDTVAKKLRLKAVLPGFRLGKAPLGLVKGRFKKEIREEVLEKVLPETATSVIEKFDLKPVVEPYTELLNFNDGESLVCELVVEVLPEIPAVTAEGITIESPKIEVTEEQIAGTIEEMRQRAGVMKPVEGEAEEGDLAEVTMKRLGSSKGVRKSVVASPKSGGPAGAELMGRKKGDIFTVKVKASADGEENEESADVGVRLEPGEYAFTVDNLHRNEVPELNDAFAKDVGEKNLDALKERVGKNMERRMAEKLEALQRDRLMDSLLAKYPFPVPPTLVDRQLKSDLEEMAEQMAQNGIDPEKVGLNWKKIAEDGRAMAGHEVAVYYLLEDVAKKSSIDVSDEDMKEYFARIVRGTELTPEDIESRYKKKKAMENLKNIIRHRKAMDLLLSQASIKVAEGVSGKEEA